MSKPNNQANLTANTVYELKFPYVWHMKSNIIHRLTCITENMLLFLSHDTEINTAGTKVMCMMSSILFITIACDKTF